MSFEAVLYRIKWACLYLIGHILGAFKLAFDLSITVQRKEVLCLFPLALTFRDFYGSVKRLHVDCWEEEVNRVSELTCHFLRIYFGDRILSYYIDLRVCNTAAFI